MADNNGPARGQGQGLICILCFRGFQTVCSKQGKIPHASHRITLLRTHLSFYEKSPRKAPRSTVHTIHHGSSLLACYTPISHGDRHSNHLTQIWQPREDLFLTLSLLRNQLLDSFPNLNSKYWSLSQAKSRKINQDQTLQVKIPTATEISQAIQGESGPRET